MDDFNASEFPLILFCFMACLGRPAYLGQRAYLGQQAYLSRPVYLIRWAYLGRWAYLDQKTCVGRRVCLSRRAYLGRPAYLGGRTSIDRRISISRQTSEGLFDHTLEVLILYPKISSGRKPIKYFRMWKSHPEYEKKNTRGMVTGDNLSLAGDGFDTVIKAKAAVDAVPSCKNKVSCADILTMATRDVVALAGGPSYAVELGRFDGKTSTASSVNGKLPKGSFNVDQLNSMFKANGLSQADMVALSAAHTLGFSHCSQITSRIWGSKVDSTLNSTYAKQLQAMCPRNVDPRIAINMDPNTPRTFDNMYYKNLQQKKGLFTSDQVLFEDSRTRPTVNAWATNTNAFNNAFISAMTKLGRVGVKNSQNGNIRINCGAFN
uniref:Peroxidase n=1 Tax=Cannabis sativa TaxID=3483 RepID=A0A803PEE8_CANSA